MRLDYREVLPEAVGAMLRLERMANSGFGDERLAHLVRLRASQMNGCAFCVRLHEDGARAAGESQERLEMVAVWREADCFSPSERAAFAWCEALTLLADREVSDELYEELARQFSERDRRAHDRDRRDQRLESPERRLSHPGERGRRRRPALRGPRRRGCAGKSTGSTDARAVKAHFPHP